jgi:hypothetical protein
MLLTKYLYRKIMSEAFQKKIGEANDIKGIQTHPFTMPGNCKFKHCSKKLILHIKCEQFHYLIDYSEKHKLIHHAPVLS